MFDKQYIRLFIKVIWSILHSRLSLFRITSNRGRWGSWRRSHPLHYLWRRWGMHNFIRRRRATLRPIIHLLIWHWGLWGGRRTRRWGFQTMLMLEWMSSCSCLLLRLLYWRGRGRRRSRRPPTYWRLIKAENIRPSISGTVSFLKWGEGSAGVHILQQKASISSTSAITGVGGFLHVCVWIIGGEGGLLLYWVGVAISKTISRIVRISNVWEGGGVFHCNRVVITAPVTIHKLRLRIRIILKHGLCIN